MNTLIKVLAAATVGMSGLISAKAVSGETYGDLIVGFTTESGNDRLEDLGSSATLINGQTWNLSSLLSGVTLTAANWGVIGDASAGDSSFLPNVSSKYDTIFATAIFTPPLAAEGTFSQVNVGTGTIIQNFSTYASGGPNQGDTLTIAATSDDSWNEETINGPLQTDIVNSYGNPNVIGLTNISLWQVTANDSAPVLLGKFSLNSSGILTFSTVSTTNAAPVAAFSGTPTKGFAPLTVVFTDTSAGSVTNRVWNFGNGRSITNNVSLTATNTYTSAGSYSVIETVTGPGGSSTNTQSSYVVVSAAPKFGSPMVSGTNIVVSGANGPAGVQYRILSTTNLALPFAAWTPVLTNTVSVSGGYSFTNSTRKSASFFLLVSP